MFSGSYKSAYKIYWRHIYDSTRTHSNSRNKAEVPPKQYRCQFQLKFPQEAKNRHKKDIGDKLRSHPNPQKFPKLSRSFFEAKWVSISTKTYYLMSKFHLDWINNMEDIFKNPKFEPRYTSFFSNNFGNLHLILAVSF